MTAFNSTMLPADIDTLEKLSIWCISILDYLNSTNTLQDTQGEAPKKIIQAYPVPVVQLDADYTIVISEWRFAGNLFLPISATWRYQAAYKSAEVVSSDPIPPEFQ